MQISKNKAVFVMLAKSAFPFEPWQQDADFIGRQTYKLAETLGVGLTLLHSTWTWKGYLGTG
jgi:hypothetical protein